MHPRHKAPKCAVNAAYLELQNETKLKRFLGALDERHVSTLGQTVFMGLASIGQVWTRHLAPAAPASRPSSPSQCHDCPCHADSALQFVPSLVPGWGKSRAASTGFRALSPSD